jgi:4-amino-4-deoxy-L-arabinose transferase-like glycosyltransferase
MAHEILHGHFSAFYWGQTYGGVEPYAVAAMFALFGQSSFTLGMTPIVLDAVAALLVWRTGRRLFGSTVGAGAALLFWIWPEVYIFNSTQEYGFRYVTLVCGLAVMLLAIRIADRAEPPVSDTESFWKVEAAGRSTRVRYLDWLALGLFAGVGWWGSPEIVYYVVPSGIFLAWRFFKRRIDLRPGFLILAVFGAVIGATPWLWANAKSHLGSLRHVAPQPHPSYTSHLSIFFTHIAPMALGLRIRANYDSARQVFVPGSGGFLVGTSGPIWTTVVGEIAYVGALIGILFWIIVLIRRKQALILVGAALLFPFLYAVSPFASDWQDGRYGLLFAPILSLLVASGSYAALKRAGKPRLAIPLAIIVGLALTLNAVTQLNPYTPVASNASRSGWFTWNANPNPGAVNLTNSVKSAHLDHVWAGFYLSWLLNWESLGAITASDVRYGPSTYYSAVESSKAPAWLFVEPESARSAGHVLDINSTLLDPGCLIHHAGFCVQPGSFEAFLARQRIAYRVVHVGPLIAVEPERPIPQKLLAALQRGVLSDKAFDIASSPGG